jgi:hypothetical protein
MIKNRKLDTVEDLIAFADELKALNIPPKMRLVNACREGDLGFGLVVDHKAVFDAGGYLTEPYKDEHRIKSFGVIYLT